jgi:hypothetical protein
LQTEKRRSLRPLLLIAALLALSDFTPAWSLETCGRDNRDLPAVSTGNPFGGPIRPRRRVQPLCFVSKNRYCEVASGQMTDVNCRCYLNGRWINGRVR